MAVTIGHLAFWAATCSVIAVTPVAAQATPVAPFDDAWRDPGLVLTRNDIIQAAIRRDTTALKGLIGESFMWSFGGGDLSDFFSHLRADPDAWNSLIEVLSLGGRLTGDTFHAPFYGSADCEEPPATTTTTADTTEDQEVPHFTCDGFERWFVLGTDVRVRSRPGGTPIAAVSLNWITKDRSLPDTRTTDGESWAPVILRDGTKGWIAGRLLRSPIGWRAGLSKGPDDKWRLTTFIAGD